MVVLSKRRSQNVAPPQKFAHGQSLLWYVPQQCRAAYKQKGRPWQRMHGRVWHKSSMLLCGAALRPKSGWSSWQTMSGPFKTFALTTPAGAPETGRPLPYMQPRSASRRHVEGRCTHGRDAPVRQNDLVTSLFCAWHSTKS